MGIRGVLLVAFAIVWGFVVLASAAAIEGLTQVTGIISEVTQQRASAIVQSSGLARQAERAITVAITAARPISTVLDPALFQQQIDEIKQAEQRLASTQRALNERRTPEQAAVLTLVNEVLDNIHALVETTRERLAVRAAVSTAVSAVASSDLSFQHVAEPERRVFGSDVAHTVSGAPAIGVVAKVQTRDSRQQLAALYNFDRVQLEFAAVYRLLTDAAQSPSVSELNLQAVVLKRELANLRDDAASLTGTTQAVRDAAVVLGELAEAPDGVIPLRRRELELLSRSSQLLDKNADISKQLLDKVDHLVAEDDNALTAGTRHAVDVAERSTRRMIAVAIVALICSLLIVWLYVFRNVAVRLELIRLAMLRLAGGDLTGDLPEQRADEVGRMAATLHVFRATAAAADRRERALENAKETAEAALAQLTEAQESLVRAEKLASLGQLVAGIAHEINTPVGIALAAASQAADEAVRLRELISTGKLKRSDLDDYLVTNQELADILTRNCQRAGQLIHDFKQVAADQTSGQRRRFDLRNHLQETLHTLQHRLERAKVTLVTDIPAGIEMDGVPGSLSQILINLIENALAHAFVPGRTTGTLTVSVCAAGAEHVEITVEDNGSGIVADVLPRIFDPFFTTNRGSGNTGLGLHIVHNLITGQLGGNVDVRSVVGLGTRFVLRLPLQLGAESPSLAVAATTEGLS
ncbi:putative histidine kinase [Pararobbsia alpina]|uniref:sensor histidine kinase n=1 Tax=Pararobbsia alpina TaxID=621374 RepID=UPI0039A449B8